MSREIPAANQQTYYDKKPCLNKKFRPYKEYHESPNNGKAKITLFWFFKWKKIQGENTNQNNQRTLLLISRNMSH